MQEGKIRYVVLSNETPWGVCQFLRLAEERGLPRDLDPERPQFAESGLRIRVGGKSAIGNRSDCWLLAVGFRPSQRQVSGRSQAPGRISEFRPGQRYTKRKACGQQSRPYCDLASRHGLALAYGVGFHRQSEFVASTIIGATTLEQLRDNIAACATVLSSEVLAGIEALHLRYTNPAPLSGAGREVGCFPRELGRFPDGRR